MPIFNVHLNQHPRCVKTAEVCVDIYVELFKLSAETLSHSLAVSLNHRYPTEVEVFTFILHFSLCTFLQSETVCFSQSLPVEQVVSYCCVLSSYFVAFPLISVTVPGTYTHTPLDFFSSGIEKLACVNQEVDGELGHCLAPHL